MSATPKPIINHQGLKGLGDGVSSISAEKLPWIGALPLRHAHPHPYPITHTDQLFTLVHLPILLLMFFWTSSISPLQWSYIGVNHHLKEASKRAKTNSSPAVSSPERIRCIRRVEPIQTGDKTYFDRGNDSNLYTKGENWDLSIFTYQIEGLEQEKKGWVGSSEHGLV